jgi:hypothetical protein
VALRHFSGTGSSKPSGFIQGIITLFFASLLFCKGNFRKDIIVRIELFLDNREFNEGFSFLFPISHWNAGRKPFGGGDVYRFGGV